MHLWRINSFFLVCQHDAGEEDPQADDLYAVGTVSRIKQALKLPGDSVRVLVEGLYRAKLVRLSEEEGFLSADVAAMQDTMREGESEMAALLRATQNYFEAYAKASGRIPAETLTSVLSVEDPAQLADILAANVLTRIDDRQRILELRDVGDRLEALCAILARETELSTIEKQVQQRVREQIEKNQKDYYLREQIRAIQTELGDREANDVEDLRERLHATPLNDEARAKVERELARIERMQPGSPEIGVSRNYVEWILDLPWGKTTQDKLDLRRARRILDEDHDGLEKVKERIVEYLAVSV